MKQYERDLHLYLHDSYLSHIPYQNQIQSLQQLHIATSIRKTIQQNNLILRVTDKGHNFYIGSAKEFEDKVQTFFQDTKAFEPLSENPFHQIKDKAIALLNQLREKGSISKKQYEEMAPDPKQTELAHLYFKPKTHKVKTFHDLTIRLNQLYSNRLHVCIYDHFRMVYQFDLSKVQFMLQPEIFPNF